MKEMDEGILQVLAMPARLQDVKQAAGKDPFPAVLLHSRKLSDVTRIRQVPGARFCLDGQEADVAGAVLAARKARLSGAVQLEGHVYWPWQILHVKKEGEGACLYLEDGTRQRVDVPFETVLEQLGKPGLRVHAKHAVNTGWVREIQRDRLRLTDGTVLPVSRTFQEAVHLAFGGGL